MQPLTKPKFQIEKLAVAKFSVATLLYFTASLYLIRFGFDGTNIYGLIDVVIPFERALLFSVGLVFLALTVLNSYRLVREVYKK